MVICLDRGADLHMAQLMPLPLTVSSSSKIQIGLLFWYRLTRVVCACVRVRVCVGHCGLHERRGKCTVERIVELLAADQFCDLERLI